ncbi:MAG: zf-HC2 domain-containing protein [Elusimicrobiales bacterium]|nr:zf-HC2 domain-containing protein [Elusimicrobiales bacterium]
MPDQKDCKYLRKLSAYMDGEIPPAKVEGLKAHLDSCAGCAAALDRMRAAESGLRALPAAESPPFFAAKVAAAAAAMKRERTSLLRFLRLPAPAAVALSAFILLNLLTFAISAAALEAPQRRELARKTAASLLRPASLINPVAVARLCGECSAYMCGCMHEAGRENLCPCKGCRMDRAAENGDITTEVKDDVD